MITGHFVYNVSRTSSSAGGEPAHGAIADYGDTYAGRYYSSERRCSPELQPVAAYRITDWLSVGRRFSVVGAYLSGKSAINTLIRPSRRPARDLQPDRGLRR